MPSTFKNNDRSKDELSARSALSVLVRHLTTFLFRGLQKDSLDSRWRASLGGGSVRRGFVAIATCKVQSNVLGSRQTGAQRTLRHLGEFTVAGLFHSWAPCTAINTTDTQIVAIDTPHTSLNILFSSENDLPLMKSFFTCSGGSLLTLAESVTPPIFRSHASATDERIYRLDINKWKSLVKVRSEYRQRKSDKTWGSC